MDIYAENILEHARSPHRKLRLAHPTVERSEINTSCGDALTLQLHFEKGRVTDIGWDGEGCAISQAAMSLLSEEIIGKKEEELASLSAGDIRALLGVEVGPRRTKCALLALHALKNALRQLHGLGPQTWRETLEEPQTV